MNPSWSARRKMLGVANPIAGAASVFAVLMLSSCGIVGGRVDAMYEFNRHLASDLDDGVRAILRSDNEMTRNALCVSDHGENGCVYIQSLSTLPTCPPFEKLENCLAIEFRASLLDNPQVRRLLQEGTSDYCAYQSGTIESGNVEVVRSIGCNAPGRPFRLFYRARPTICLLAIGSGQDRSVVHKFAVSGRRRVHNWWCDSVG